MVRRTSWFVVCLALVALTACAGPRAGGSCCEPVCNTCCSEEPGPQPCDRPPEAKPGEAWCRVWVPPVTKEVTERVCVCPEKCRTIRLPAQYGTRPKLVCVSPAKVTEHVKPAVWTTETEEVCIRGPRTVYRKVDCDTKVEGAVRQCECWVKEECPPVLGTREKCVCLAPPKKTLQYTPAKYEMREEKYMVCPPRCVKEKIPAKYEERTRTVCVSPGRWEWRRNTDCEVPVEKLPALEVEMVDSDPQGGAEGIFEQGSIVRYDLTVRSDVGSEAFPTIKVEFTLPEHLDFISGEGMGVAITGSGQAASSSTFKLSPDQEVRMHILARVVSVPPTTFVQTTASVQTVDGEELATETESTSLAKKGEK